MKMLKILLAVVAFIITFFVAAMIFSSIPGFRQPAGGGYSAVNGIGLIASILVAGLVFWLIVKHRRSV